MLFFLWLMASRLDTALYGRQSLSIIFVCFIVLNNQVLLPNSHIKVNIFFSVFIMTTKNNKNRHSSSPRILCRGHIFVHITVKIAGIDPSNTTVHLTLKLTCWDDKKGKEGQATHHHCTTQWPSTSKIRHGNLTKYVSWDFHSSRDAGVDVGVATQVRSVEGQAVVH